MMPLLKTLRGIAQSRAKAFLRPILTDLPPPYNPHRPENRIILFLASVLVSLLILYNLAAVVTSRSISSSKPGGGGVFSTSSLATAFSNDGDSIASEYALAYRESLGFFDDIPEDVWREKKKRVREQPRHNDAKLGLRSKFADRAHASIWYQNNWEAEFTCPHERRIGGSGDGAKWTCDPHRIQSVANRRSKDVGGETAPRLPTNPCLVYSVGHHGRRPRHVADPSYFDFSYEQSLLSTLASTTTSSTASTTNCEIHVFDSWLKDYRGPSPPGMILHPWGLEGVVDAPSGRRDFMTLGETVQLLGHGGREVDVFKVDCEACEWHTFREWFDHGDGSGKGGKKGGVVMRQILVELHGAPKFGDDFFEVMERNGFVIFHREADTQYA